MPKKIPTDDIIYNGTIYRYGGSADKPTIRNYTADKGWAGGKSGMKKDEIEDLWKFMVENQDRSRVIEKRGCDLVIVPANKTAVAKVEKSKCPTMGHLQPIAGQINEKFERFQVVEKEATMIMLEVGLAIEYVKEQLPHGQLEKWVKENLTISRSHAQRFRELARVFIKANSIKEDEMFLLCDPANSKEALGEKLRQMAFDFLGDKTQAELFEQYKIKYKEPAKLTYHPPKDGGNDLPEGETKEHFVSKSTWDEIAGMLNTHGLGSESWANLNHAERQSLYDIVHELDRRLKASLKN